MGRFTWGSMLEKTQPEGRQPAQGSLLKWDYTLKVGERVDFGRRNQLLGCFGIGYYQVFLSWEELWHTVGWCLTEAASSHLGDSSHRLGAGIFDATKLVQQLAIAAFLHGIHLQCKWIKMSLGVTLGQSWKRRAHASYLWLIGLSAPRSQKPQDQDIVSLTCNV